MMKREMLEFFFPDLTYINATIFNGVTTAEELWWLTCEAICLKQDKRQNFFLNAVGNDMDLHLRCEDVVTDIIDNWMEIEKQYIREAQHPCRIMLKPISSLSLNYESFEIKDEMAVHILFTDLIRNIEKGFYEIELDEASVLGGMKAQILLGDYDQEKHGHGYISENINSLNG